MHIQAIKVIVAGNIYMFTRYPEQRWSLHGGNGASEAWSNVFRTNATEAEVRMNRTLNDEAALNVLQEYCEWDASLV